VYIITTFIKEGRKDILAVKQLQALLIFLGERLIVDGNFGARSTIAVKKFQKEQHLVADGKVGEGSWFKLYEVALESSKMLMNGGKSHDVLRVSSTNRDSIVWLESILYLIDKKTKTTGVYSKILEARVRSFQKDNNCSEDGIVGNEVWGKLFEKHTESLEGMYGRLLNDAYISKRAKENGLSPAAVKAVVKVESNGRGFQRDGRLKILFEGHIFWKELKSVNINPYNFEKGNENVLFKSFTRKYYASSLQYARLNKAKKINKQSALKSASYGMFQVMGFNHKLSGFKSVEAFIKYIKVDEANQLEAFFNFIKNRKGCFEALQAKQWAKFARIYNGPAYKVNKYDTKLDKNYNASSLAKGVRGVIDEERYTSLYALELEKAFYAFEES